MENDKVIKLKDLLTEKYGTYANNAQNKALKRVGKNYGSTQKTYRQITKSF